MKADEAHPALLGRDGLVRQHVHLVAVELRDLVDRDYMVLPMREDGSEREPSFARAHHADRALAGVERLHHPGVERLARAARRHHEHDPGVELKAADAAGIAGVKLPLLIMHGPQHPLRVAHGLDRIGPQPVTPPVHLLLLVRPWLDRLLPLLYPLVQPRQRLLERLCRHRSSPA